MLRNILLPMTAGAGVGVVIQESIWFAGEIMTPSISLAEAMTRLHPGPPWLGLLISGWLSGGAVAGLMGSLLGRGRIGAYSGAFLLAAGAWLQIELTWPGAGGLAAFALTPIAGAVAGSALGMRLLACDTNDQHPRSLLT